MHSGESVRHDWTVIRYAQHLQASLLFATHTHTSNSYLVDFFKSNTGHHFTKLDDFFKSNIEPITHTGPGKACLSPTQRVRSTLTLEVRLSEAQH